MLIIEEEDNEKLDNEDKKINNTNLLDNNLLDIHLFDRYLLGLNFKKCIQGYHMINSPIINETIWEDINSIVFSSSNIDVYTKSDGSHVPGMDINSSIGRISNKSA